MNKKVYFERKCRLCGEAFTPGAEDIRRMQAESDAAYPDAPAMTEEEASNVIEICPDC